MIVDHKQISGMVEKGLDRLMKITLDLWPDDNQQILERNLSFYAGIGLVEGGFAIVQEWPLAGNQHLDMVAYYPNQGGTLVVVESKRIWQSHGQADVKAVETDIARINKESIELRRWSYQLGKQVPLAAARIFGVALASASGRERVDAQKNCAQSEQALQQCIGKFQTVPHQDQTYFVLYRIWQVK